MEPIVLLVLASSAVVASVPPCASDAAIVVLSPDCAVAVCEQGVVRVVRTPPAVSAKEALQARESLMVAPDFAAEAVGFNVTRDVPSAGDIMIETDLIQTIFLASTSTLSFYDRATGLELLSEVAPGKFTPTKDLALPGDRSAYIVEQSWSADDGEGLYGGGEFQNGLVGFRGTPVELVQYNTEAAVPFFASTKGYGLLWDNNAWSYLNPPTTAPLNFTADDSTVRLHRSSRQTPSPYDDGSGLVQTPSPYGDGSGLVLAVCAPDDVGQSWDWQAADGTLHLRELASEVLDCDGCEAGHPPHIWHLDGPSAPNQLWKFQLSHNGDGGGQLQSVAHTTCLGVSSVLSGRATHGGTAAVIMEPCATGTTRWQYDATSGALALSEGGNEARDNHCLAVAGGQRVAHFTPSEDGDHYISVELCPHEYGCGFDHEVYVTVTDTSSGHSQVVQEWDRLTNLPDSIAGRAASLKAGTPYTITYIGDLDLFPATQRKAFVSGPAASRTTTLRSELGNMIDYFVTFNGAPSLDGAIAGYRAVTGAAPMYAKYAYGFWQCKEHYASQAELVAAAARFRAEKIPLDAIVQDWHYWGDLGWGPQWDATIYPDPAGMVSNLSATHLKLMVSVWSRFDEQTTFFANMSAHGFLISDNFTDTNGYYDAWNPDARELFYQFSREAMFTIGVEALWLDATEPEGFPNKDHAVALGSGNALHNSYSLMTSRAIAEGLRRDYPSAQGRRVFSLTRSAFAGQQRTGACLWSGDISGSWDSLRRQIAASLNYGLSGMPYWSEDIGGFFRPDGQHDASTGYYRLLTRWFQFGVFTPIFRVHGTNGDTELWAYGPSVQSGIVSSAINLRYRLLPYIYSGFHRVMMDGWTMQRALAFDFGATDAIARQAADQFLFGSALLVAPVYNDVEWRQVYFPEVAGGGWRSFHTGEVHTAGTHNVSAPLLQVPLYARAGSLLPLGPELQYTGEKQPSQIELRLYDGADATMTLYEDDGESSDWTASTTMTIQWEESSQQLHFSARHGKGFPGMLTQRVFDVVRVRPGHGVGVNATQRADISLSYDGSEVVVTLPAWPVR